MVPSVREPFRAGGCRPSTAGSDARRYFQKGPQKFPQGSKRKAVTAQAEKSGIAARDGFDAGKELMHGVIAAAVMTIDDVFVSHSAEVEQT
jgi:hypothetical protein